MADLSERFGKYIVLERIAQGGMAEVYKVKATGIAGFEKIQALKRIRPQSVSEERFIRGFIDEARIAVELSHRNIVHIYDFGKAQGELYLAMELVEGVDLRTALTLAAKQRTLVPRAVAAYVVSEAAAGIDYAHRKSDGYGRSLGIVHCDVSPANIMLSHEGYVKVLDFGIARATFASAFEQRRLRGKPRYMAPEQTYGEAATAASDVFALGVIAWELFAGRALFSGADLRAVLAAVRRCEVPPLEPLAPGLPGSVITVIERALSPEPDARGNAADIAGTLARLGGESGARGLAEWLGRIQNHEPSPWLGAGTDDSGSPFPAGRGPRGPNDTAVMPVAGNQGSRARDEQATMQLRVTDPLAPKAPPPVAEIGTRSSVIGLRPQDDAVFDAAFDAAFSDSNAQPLGDDDGPTGVEELVERVTQHGGTVDSQLIDLANVRPARAKASSGATLDEPDFRFDVEASGSSDAVAPLAEYSGQEAAIDDRQPDEAVVQWVERRKVVVTACQVAPSKSSAGTERSRELTRALADLAYQRGGVAISLDDHAVIVVFGLEVAGEDDAAVATGWTLEAIRRAKREGIRTTFGIRLGVMSTLDAGRQSVDPEGIAEAVDLAAAATPDHPRVSGRLSRATSGQFELRDIVGEGAAGVKEILGVRVVAQQGIIASERRGRFVGRQKEMSELIAASERAAREGGWVTVQCVGAVGVGKTRLCAEFAATLSERAVAPRIVSISTLSATQAAPYSLLIELVAAGLMVPPPRGRPGRVRFSEHLDHILAGLPARERSETAAALMSALELRDGVLVGDSNPIGLRERVVHALAALLAAMRAGAPMLVFLIDDAHLADSTSLAVLAQLLGETGVGVGMVVLIIEREAGRIALRAGEVIEVGDLGSGDAYEMAADRLGFGASTAAVTAVAERSGGNPMMLEEFARAVKDNRGGLPDSAGDTVAARVEKLSAQAEATLAFAAVTGAMIRVPLLEDLIGADVEPPLEELEAVGLLVARDSARAAVVDDEWAFPLPHLRLAVYQRLPLARRRELHGKVGQLLAARYFAGRDEAPMVIADHLERSGELAMAAAFWLRAARVSISAADAGAAVAAYTKVLELERALGPEPLSQAGRQRRIEALSGREEGNRMMGELHRNPTDLDDLMKLVERDTRRQADVMMRRAQRALSGGDLVASVKFSERAEQLARDAGDLRLRADAVAVRGEAFERQARYSLADAALQQARNWYAQLGASRAEAATMMIHARMNLARGQVEAARDTFRLIIRRLPKLRDPELERSVRMHVAVAQLHLGNFADSMSLARHALDMCRRFSDRAREGECLVTLGAVHVALGLYDAAADHFSAAFSALAGAGPRWAFADCLVHAGICDVRRGLASGLEMIDQGARHASAIGARYIDVHAQLARSEAAARSGDFATSLACANAAVSAAQAATLFGFEAIGLARQAVATAELAAAERPGPAGMAPPTLSAAADLAERAIALVTEIRYVDGSVEEVLCSSAAVLERCGFREEAANARAVAKQSTERKLGRITEPTWRAAFAAIGAHRDLLS